MKTIGKDEFYQNVSAFMKSKGIELTDGAYAAHIRRGCGLLSDAINAAQRAVTTAKKEVDEKLARLRRCIHDATSGPQPPPSPAPAPTPAAAPSAGPQTTAAGKPAGKPGVKRGRKSASSAKPAPVGRRPRQPKPTS